MRFEDFLNCLPTNLPRLCRELGLRRMDEQIILLKRILRGAFDSGRYNDPDYADQLPAPFVPMPKSEESQQQEKWSGLWRTRDFRIAEPSPSSALAALKCWDHHRGTLIDFGCGRGHALNFFQQQDFDVLGIDIASNALDEHLAGKLPLLRACLWSLPNSVSANCGYCVDVMEHIPKERIKDTLINISVAAAWVFFQMQTTGPHAYGKDAEWWQERLQQVWPHAHIVDQTEERVQLYAY